MSDITKEVRVGIVGLHRVVDTFKKDVSLLDKQMDKLCASTNQEQINEMICEMYNTLDMLNDRLHEMNAQTNHVITDDSWMDDSYGE